MEGGRDQYKVVMWRQLMGIVQYYRVRNRMQNEQEYVDAKTIYSKITYNKRLRLIEMVEKKNYSIYRAAKQLAISNSTAKLIIKNFRDQGRIFQKKDQRLAHQTPPTIIPPPEEQPILKQENESQARPDENENENFRRLLLDYTQLNLQSIFLQMHSQRPF